MIAGLAERLRVQRARKNLTQQQVSERIGITRATMSSYEQENNTPPADVIMKLAKLYGVSADYLLGLDGGKTISVDGLTDDQITTLLGTRDTFLNHK